ncbi:MAG: uL30 family ribosomal protein [Nanoarchaeota archaeon]
MSKIAVIRISSSINRKKEIVDTLNMLNLPKKYSCTVIEDTPSNKGMLQKVKDCVTWGVLDEKTEKLLAAKDKKTIALQPPKGGFERRGTKKSFATGGALGNRGEKINDLLAKMIE